MRIYVYTPAFVGQIGFEQSLQQLIQGLTARGHECKVLVMRTPEQLELEEDKLGPNVIVCGIGRGKFERPADPMIHAILDLQHTLRKLPVPDVMMTLTPLCTGAARATVESMTMQTVIISRVSSALGKYDNYEQLAYADAHLAMNSGIAEKIVEMNAQAVVKMIYHPIPDNDVSFVPRATEVATFVYIGRMFNIQKRVDVLFRALAALPNKKWRLKLIEDAPQEPGSSDDIRMKDLAIKLGIADRIDWIGYVPYPWEEVTEATVLILPSDWEAFCYVLIEALMRGIPVISSDCPTGPRDIIQHGHNGWLFKPGDVLGLAGTISRIMSGSLTLPEPEVCRQSVAHYDHDLVMDHIEQALFAYARHEEQIG